MGSTSSEGPPPARPEEKVRSGLQTQDLIETPQEEEEVSYEEDGDSYEEEEEEEEGSSEEEEVDSQEKGEEASPRTLKIGDSEFSLDLELDLKTKGGKEAKVKVEELINDYWGKSEVSRKLTEIDRFQKEVLAPKEKVVNYVENLVTSLRNKAQDDKLGAVETLISEMTNLVPELRPAIQEFYSYMYDEFGKLSTMSPEQREQYNLLKENETLKKQTQARVSQDQNERTNQVISDRLTSLEGTYNISRDDLKRHYSSLVEDGKISEDMPIEASLNALEDAIVVDGYIQGARKVLEMYGQDTDEDSILDLVNYQIRHGGDKAKLEARAEGLFGHSKKAKNRVLKNSKASGKTLSPSNKKPKKKEAPKTSPKPNSDPIKDFYKKFGIQSF